MEGGGEDGGWRFGGVVQIPGLANSDRKNSRRTERRKKPEKQKNRGRIAE